MTTLVARLLLLAVAGWILWVLWRLRRRPEFVVRVEEGEPRVESGVVTAAFLRGIREVLARHGVQTGRIAAQPRGGHVSLAFSRDIPPAACQQLRNGWALQGWNAQKR